MASVSKDRTGGDEKKAKVSCRPAGLVYQEAVLHMPVFVLVYNVWEVLITRVWLPFKGHCILQRQCFRGKGGRQVTRLFLHAHLLPFSPGLNEGVCKVWSLHF